MIPLIVISAIAIVYALLRAKHDSYISDGKWKLFAFIEGIFVDGITIWSVLTYFGLHWYQGFGLGLIFGFVFWIVFDCYQGWLRTGNILYIGEYGWDAKVRAAFFYDKPFLGINNTKSLRYLLVKLFSLTLITLCTISLIKTYN